MEGGRFAARSAAGGWEVFGQGQGYCSGPRKRGVLPIFLRDFGTGGRLKKNKKKTECLTDIAGAFFLSPFPACSFPRLLLSLPASFPFLLFFVPRFLLSCLLSIAFSIFFGFVLSLSSSVSSSLYQGPNDANLTRPH